MELSQPLAQLLHQCSQNNPLPVSLDDWYSQTLQAWAQTASSGGRALLAGATADRLGYAFAGGYSAALQRLLQDTSARMSAFCVTETGGNQPRDITTTLTPAEDGWRLEGEKTFVTLADRAEWLWVAACAGERDGRKIIKLVGVPSDQAGVHLTTLPHMPFVPEIGHAKVRFTHVHVVPGDILPGDGYADYVKPFRTVEDIHVSAACCGLLLSQAIRQQWPRHLTTALLGLAFGWLSIAEQSAHAPATHLVLNSLMQQQQQLIETVTPWIVKEPTFAALWQRDLALLNVAEKARKQRTEIAWQALLASHSTLAHA